MEDPLFRELLVEGIAAAKAHEANVARRYLERLLRLDPPTDEKVEASFWLSEISIDPAEKRDFLEVVLANNPSDMRARRALAILDGKLNPTEIVDPDRPAAAAPSGVMDTPVDRFTCPRCGGRMTFTPDGASLTCEYCETHQAINTGLNQRSGQVADKDFLIAMATGKGQATPIQMRSFCCQGCGISFILPPEQMSMTCPYCGSVYVIDQVETRQMQVPDGIIPFKVDKVQANQALSDWINKPVMESHEGHLFQGIYTPAWAFDISGTIPWNCLKYVNKQWIPEKGEELVLRQNCLVPASQHQHPKLQVVLERFKFTDLVPYDHRYLADWLAETYQVSAAEAALDARKAVLDAEHQEIDRSITTSIRDLYLKSTNITVDSYKLVLLPVWFYHLVLDDKPYEGYINGQSGEAFGERPGIGLVNWFKKFV